MGSNDMPELGSKISLISKADIRYEGKLFTVDPQDCTIALANVRSFGTEERVTDHPVPAQAQVYDYILFRATDIKDISVIPSPPVLFDPAIVQLSVPPSIGPGSGTRFQGGFQHPIVGAFGGSSSEPSSRTVVVGGQSSYNPMQSSSLLNPLQQRSRQTRSVAELLGSTGAGGGGGGGGGGGSRSSTPGLGRRIPEQGNQSSGNQRQSPPRYGAPDQANQRNRNNSQSNSSNNEDRSYSSRQYSQSKPRDQQQQQHQQQHHQQQPQHHQQPHHQQQRFGNRNMDNGYNRDNRNDGGYNRDNAFNNRDNRNDGGYIRNMENAFSNRNQMQNMQQRRFQNPGGQQNQRMNPRGGSGDRLQDQQQRGPNGQRRNQGWSNNGQRQGGQRQGGQRQGQRRQFGFNQGKQQQPKKPLKFDSDYDFDKANTEFEELRLSLAQVKIGDGNNVPVAVGNQAGGNTDDKKDDSGNETAVGECDQEDEGIQQSSSAYDKTKSFFDNISCEALERSKGRSQRTDWRKELKLNSETFGVTMSRRFYVPRGRGYYNRGNSWNYKPRQQQNNMIAAKV